MLKLFVKSLDEVDEKFHDLYEKSEDGFFLKVDDKGYKSKLDEFRSNNRSLYNEKKTLEEQISKYKGIDPETYQELLEIKKRLEADEEGKLIKEGKIDEVVKRRVQAYQANIDNQVKELNKERERLANENAAYKSRLSELVIDTEVQKTISKLGAVRPGAMTDILNRARSIFKIDENGQMVPYDQNGGIRYGKNGSDPLSLDEWAQGLLQEAPYLFEPGSGGGASGGKKDTQKSGSKIRVNRRDPMAMGKYAEQIASGEAVAVDE